MARIPVSSTPVIRGRLMGLIGSARKAVLHVHPEELTNLQKYVPELLAKMRGIESATWRLCAAADSTR